jgi:hypothetical protein
LVSYTVQPVLVLPLMETMAPPVRLPVPQLTVGVTSEVVLARQGQLSTI